MPDLLIGTPIAVYDNRNFCIKVKTKSRPDYKDEETIRIASIDSKAVYVDGKFSILKLKDILTGHSVKCYVLAKDSEGRLVCDVKIF